MAKEIVEIDLKINDLSKNVKKATEGFDKLDKEIQDTKDSTKELGGESLNLGGTLDGVTGGAFSGFKKLADGVKTTAKGFSGLKVAIISSGIGALAIGILAIVQAFKRSEAGQDKFAKIMNIIGVATGKFLDLLSGLGMKIIETFENPKKAISDFADLIKKNITNRFDGLLNLIPNLGKAITQLFKGNFKEAGKIAADSVGKVVTGLDSVTDTIAKAGESLKGFVKDVVDASVKAGQISDNLAKADKIERQLLIDRAKADRERAKLLEEAVDKEKFTLEERIAKLQEAGRLEDEITNKEIQAKAIRLQSQREQNALGESTKDDLNAEAQLQAELIDLETAKLRKQKLVTSQIIALKNEERANEKALADQKIAEDKAKKDLEIAELKAKEDAITKILQDSKEKRRVSEEEAYLLSLETDAEREIAKIELEAERKIAELERLQKGLDAENEIYKQAEEEKAKIKGDTAKGISKVNENEKKKEEQLEKDVAKAKVDIAKNTLGLIGAIAGEGSKVGKAVAIGQATISGIEGVQNAYTTAQKSPITAVFPAYPIIQAGLAGAFSALQIKKIASTKVGKNATASSSSFSTPSGGGGGAVSIPRTPNFNVVGASETNQLANAIGSQSQAPIKAYVVSTEISSKQELDRNIQKGAEVI